MEGVGVAKIAQIMDLCNFLPDMELKGHRIMISDVNRPALQLSGYFKHFEQSRGSDHRYGRVHISAAVRRGKT